MANIPSLNQLRSAVKVGEKIEALETELAGIFQNGSKPALKGAHKLPAVKHTLVVPSYKAKKTLKLLETGLGIKQRRTMSPEARERMAAAQKKRWRKHRRQLKLAAKA